MKKTFGQQKPQTAGENNADSCKQRLNSMYHLSTYSVRIINLQICLPTQYALAQFLAPCPPARSDIVTPRPRHLFLSSHLFLFHQLFFDPLAKIFVASLFKLFFFRISYKFFSCCIYFSYLLNFLFTFLIQGFASVPGTKSRLFIAHTFSLCDVALNIFSVYIHLLSYSSTLRHSI